MSWASWICTALFKLLTASARRLGTTAAAVLPTSAASFLEQTFKPRHLADAVSSLNSAVQIQEAQDIVVKGRTVMPHSEVMNIVTSGNPHAQALLMGLLAHFTPAQRQYVLALLPPGKGRNLPAGGRGGGAFAASLRSATGGAASPPTASVRAAPVRTTPATSRATIAAGQRPRGTAARSDAALLLVQPAWARVEALPQVRSRLQEKCEEEEQRRKRQLMPPPQGQGEQQRQAQAEQAARFVKGEYARCRLALDKLQRCDILDAETDAVSLGLLYPGADSASIRQRPVLIRSIRTRLEELESQHAINPADWVDGSEAFKAGLAELAKGEVLKLQSELEEAVADYWSLEYVIQHLSGRRKEQGYAIRDKSQTKQRIEGMWGRLVSWCKVAGAVSAALASAIKEPDALQKAMGQKFPWGVEGGPQEGKTSRLRAALLRSYHDRKRGNEEVALIVAEIEKAINKCERRVQLLSDALSQSDDRTLPGRLRLLRLHLGRNERMLVAFRLLKEGQIPRDQSAIIDEDW
ncbi:hypothetical protein PLESTB_001355800 [Pleodorina starrii]|uniref:Uncharacterized protein n=1 Tax=Pleodorina starrii TaxID=330485 RepID=A0A9W6F796_9CHLO|nr:hypothetical protein PLESTB_001355800 [Pleodorina starrii]GLC76474.1 hypothetical protein PLESTF_001785200 [Pleodorina starrii]